MFSLAKYQTYFLSYKTAPKDQNINGTTQIVLVVRCSSLNFDFTEKNIYGPIVSLYKSSQSYN